MDITIHQLFQPPELPRSLNLILHLQVHVSSSVVVESVWLFECIAPVKSIWAPSHVPSLLILKFNAPPDTPIFAVSNPANPETEFALLFANFPISVVVRTLAQQPQSSNLPYSSLSKVPVPSSEQPKYQDCVPNVVVYDNVPLDVPST